MKRYLSGIPSIRFKDLYNGKNKMESTFPFNHKRCQYYFSARYALAGGLKAIGINPGEKVLIPSYNCGVELGPFYHFNIEPVFYKVDKNLRVDIEELVRIKDKNIKALMITHYLGFPQEIDEIEKYCKEKNIYLIEDCAHSFLSNFKEQQLGSYGDIAFFSILKTLPVPNGGLLIINRDELNYNLEKEKPNIFTTMSHMIELYHLKTFSDNKIIEKLISESLYLFWKNIKHLLAVYKKTINPGALYLIRPDSDYFIENIMKWEASSFTLRIIRNTNFDSIKMIRRRNFEYLLNHFLKNERGILPFTKLPPGVCPLFFPIILESGEKREKLYKTLKNKGVITHPWWDRFHPKVPWDEFPDAVYLKSRLFGIPIHQDLTLNHLDRVIEEFEKTYQSI